MILFVFLAFFILQKIDAMTFRRISPEEFKQQYFPSEDIKTIFIEDQLEVAPRENSFFTTNFLDLTKINRIYIKDGARLKFSNLYIKVYNLVIEQEDKQCLIMNLKEIAHENFLSLMHIDNRLKSGNYDSVTKDVFLRLNSFFTFTSQEDVFYKKDFTKYCEKFISSSSYNKKNLNFFQNAFKINDSTKFLLINDEIAQEVSLVHLNNCTITVEDQLTFLSSLNLSNVKFNFNGLQNLVFINPLLFEWGFTESNFEPFYKKINFIAKNIFFNTKENSFVFNGMIQDFGLLNKSAKENSIIFQNNLYFLELEQLEKIERDSKMALESLSSLKL